MQNQLLCITGPTASGKTDLAVFLAQRLGTEIISADSMQIYQGMDIGTAKPSMLERAGIPHHLLDILLPTQSYSVAQFVTQADQVAQRLLAEGKLPIVAGGTAMYMDALVEGNTFAGEDTNLALRAHYDQLAKERGNAYVHQCLEQVDPVAAKRLHPNNLKRVIRALEVLETTGYTIDTWNAMHKRAKPKYEAIWIGLQPKTREQLYQRIDKRVHDMIAQGLVEEVRTLYEGGMLTATAEQAIGYKELLAYLQGQATLEECITLIQQRSRNYAKRQLTWLKRNPHIHWILYDADAPNAKKEVQEQALTYLGQTLDARAIYGT